MPPSQLDGREPAEVTEHRYDGAGRLVRSVTTREARFTEADRAELLALAAHRESLCPACGGPLEECTSHEATGPRFRATYVLCRRREQLSIAQKAHEMDRPEAAVWSMTTMRPR